MHADGAVVSLPGRARLYVRQAGAGDPVLLVHGWPQHSAAWRNVVPLLAPHRRLVMPDLRGFGRSEHTAGGYDIDTLAGDLRVLLDALAIPAAQVVGHDWGGYVSLRLAEMAPERVTSVLAISTPHLWISMTPRMLRGAWKGWYAAALALPGGGRFAPWGLMTGVSASAGLDPMWADHLREPGKARATTKLYRSYFRQIGYRGRRDGPFPPTRILIGSEEEAFPIEAALGGDLPPWITTEVLDGAGHWIPEHNPEAVCKRVLAR